MTLRIEATGAQTLIEDGGRVGYGHLGVPRAGAFDQRSWRLANRLVGNPENTAALESLGGGLTLIAQRRVTVAVTGARGIVLVDDRPRDVNTPLHLEPGQRLHLTAPTTGIRYYLAMAGGIVVDPVLGSRSRDTLGDIGPTVSSGTILQQGLPRAQPGVDHAPVHPPALQFQITPGPDATRRLLEEFTRRDWDLDPQSNRIGVRLLGTPLSIADVSIPSKPMVLGAVQVPPNGLPIVLGPDHPTTGGYPVIAVVTRHSMDDLAQWSGGSRRFIPVADADSGPPLA